VETQAPRPPLWTTRGPNPGSGGGGRYLARVRQQASVLHLDLDAFFAAVEQRDKPSLRGKPVVVGGGGRGVVSTASYEARRYGVRSAMSTREARSRCPYAAFLSGRFHAYRSTSHAVMRLLRSVSPLVEPLSLDEAYLDVTDNLWGEPLATNIAKTLKARIREEIGLTASAGVAPNKFLAKIASGWQKPDGLTVIAPERVETFLQGLPVDALWGVGPVTARKLRARGIEKLVDVRAADAQLLRDTVGSLADWLEQLARGVDDRPVVPQHDPKSSGSETTYEKDLASIDDVRAEIDSMGRDAAAWLERKALYARTVTIKVRYSDFTTITRSHTEPATRDPESIASRAVALLEKTDAGRTPIRLLGVSVHNLTDAPLEPPGQPPLPF
jgi:DNA polymerase-4